MLVQSLPREAQRRDDRQLALGEFGRERVLLEDGRIAPAASAVELGDERRAFVEHT